MNSTEDATYYSVLEVNESATAIEITTAYRRLAYEYHPDRLPPEVRSRRIGRDATEVFQQVQEAYGVLSDPLKRKQYDDALARHRGHQPETSDSASASTQSSEPAPHGAPTASSSPITSSPPPPASGVGFASSSANGKRYMLAALAALLLVAVSVLMHRSATSVAPEQSNQPVSVSIPDQTAMSASPAANTEANCSRILWDAIVAFVSDAKAAAGTQPTKDPYETAFEFAGQLSSWNASVKAHLDSLGVARGLIMVELNVTSQEYLADSEELVLLAGDTIPVPAAPIEPVVLCNVDPLLACNYFVTRQLAYVTVRDRATIHVPRDSARAWDLSQHMVRVRVALQLGTAVPQVDPAYASQTVALAITAKTNEVLGIHHEPIATIPETPGVTDRERMSQLASDPLQHHLGDWYPRRRLDTSYPWHLSLGPIRTFDQRNAGSVCF